MLLVASLEYYKLFSLPLSFVWGLKLVLWRKHKKNCFAFVSICLSLPADSFVFASLTPFVWCASYKPCKKLILLCQQAKGLSSSRQYDCAHWYASMLQLSLSQWLGYFYDDILFIIFLVQKKKYLKNLKVKSFIPPSLIYLSCSSSFLLTSVLLIFSTTQCIRFKQTIDSQLLTIEISLTWRFSLLSPSSISQVSCFYSVKTCNSWAGGIVQRVKVSALEP